MINAEGQVIPDSTPLSVCALMCLLECILFCLYVSLCVWLWDDCGDDCCLKCFCVTCAVLLVWWWLGKHLIVDCKFPWGKHKKTKYSSTMNVIQIKNWGKIDTHTKHTQGCPSRLWVGCSWSLSPDESAGKSIQWLINSINLPHLSVRLVSKMNWRVLSNMVDITYNHCSGDLQQRQTYSKGPF